MITAKLYINDGTWTELPVYNNVEFDERLDEELDSGSVQVISKSGMPFADYTLYRLKFMQDDETIIDESYFGFDTVEQRGEDYYIHTIELVEITRIAMGIPIDGCKVTQPIEGEKKSLYDVAFSFEGGLISKAKLESVADRELYLHPASGDMIEKMKNVPSPEFHWECGTLLWECLCDVGNVINCIPRARFVGTNTDRLFIEFIPVNDITEEYEL
ncbi:MAG: hypothetical protein IJV85_01220 [Clostridia bacterium]|nr:hypothetical protein [Clostridia bacterium]